VSANTDNTDTHSNHADSKDNGESGGRATTNTNTGSNPRRDVDQNPGDGGALPGLTYQFSAEREEEDEDEGVGSEEEVEARLRGEYYTLAQELKTIKRYFIMMYPFLFIPLHYTPIYATTAGSGEGGVDTAAATADGKIVLNLGYWSTLTTEEKRAAVAHEVLHLVLMHNQRRGDRNHYLWNVATDAKVNSAVEKVQGTRIPKGTITLNEVANAIHLPVQLIENLSAEELYSLLAKMIPPPRIHILIATNSDLDNGKPVTRGGKAVLVKPAAAKRLPDEARRVLKEAEVFGSLAGNIPAGLQRLIDEVIERKPPWDVTLRAAATTLIHYDTTYARANRRSDLLPGYEGYKPRIWVLTDTSGSITDEELKAFLGVAKGALRHAGEIVVVPWDAEVYQPIKVTSPTQAAAALKKIQGGGGTVVLPALKWLTPKLRPADMVALLTDGEIYDLGKEETRKQLRELASHAAKAYIAWTKTKIEVQGWISAQLTVPQAKTR